MFQMLVVEERIGSSECFQQWLAMGRASGLKLSASSSPHDLCLHSSYFTAILYPV